MQAGPNSSFLITKLLGLNFGPLPLYLLDMTIKYSVLRSS
jgi:hypothetical protein